MPRNADPADDETLGRLIDILGVARQIARELSEDPLLARMLSVFHAMPVDDRPTIIAILEREILGRHMSRGTEKTVGQATHLNPNARLYIRSHETQLDHRHFDLEQMHVANVRAMRIAPIIRHVPGIYAFFKEALRSAMNEVDEPTRAVAEELLHDVLAAIADARVAGAQTAVAEPPATAPPGETPAVDAAPVADEGPRRS